MKNKNLLLMLALPVAFAACSDEELQTINTNPVADGEMIATADLTLTASKSFGNVDSRANWVADEDGNYAFHWTSNADAVGLAYVGEGTTAVTNYNFTAEKIYNANLLPKTTLSATDALLADCYQAFGYTLNSDAAWEALYDGKDATTGERETLAAEHIVTTSEYAKFKTVNDYILKGKYVAYFPAVGSELFAETGNIPVYSPASLTFTNEADNLAKAAAKTFQYSQKENITEAGDQVTHFTLNPLSAIFNIQIKSKEATTSTIKTVIIVAKNGEKFVTKASLNGIPATAGKDALTNIDATASVAALTLNSNPVQLAASSAANPTNFYMPVLPATFTTGFDIILINNAGKAYTISKSFTTFNVESATVYPMAIEVPADAEFTEYLATDATTFDAAVASIQTDAASAPVTATIKLFNNIEGAGAVALNATNAINLTIEGDCTAEVGTITLTSGNTLNVNNTLLTAAGLTNAGTVNVNGEAVIEGNLVNTNILNVKAEGELTVAGGTASSNTSTIDVFGTMNLESRTVAPNTYYTNLSNTSKVIVRANAEFNNNAGSTITNEGQLTCDGDFINNGHIKEVGNAAVVTGMKYQQGTTGAFSKVVDSEADLKDALLNDQTTSGVAYTTVYMETASALTLTFDEDFTATKGIIISNNSGVAQNLTLNIKGGKTVSLGSILAASLTINNSDATKSKTSIAKLNVNSGYNIALSCSLTVGVNTESTFNGALTNEAGTFGYTAVSDPAKEVKGIISCTSFSGAGTWNGIPSIIAAE